MNGRLNRRLIGVLCARLPELMLALLADPRVRAARWPLETILVAVLIGLTANCHNLRQVERLTKKLSKALRRRLKVARRLPDTTVRDVLVEFDPHDLRPALHRQVKLAQRRKALKPHGLPLGVVAIDGRTTSTPITDKNCFAQTQHDEQGRERSGLVRTVTSTLVSSMAKVCVDIFPIPGHTNEMGIFPRVFLQLVKTYSEELFQVVTADPGSCSEANGRLVEQHNRAYLFRLKAGDQPTLYEEARRLLGRMRPEQAETTTVDQVGKMVVIRRVWRTAEMAGWHGWDPHLRTVLRVESERITPDGNDSLEQRYYISSLRLGRLSADQWLELVRRHWDVENANHWVFDAILAEDNPPWIYEPRGMLAVMVLRRIAFNLLALYRCVTQRSEDKRRMPWKDLMRDFYDALVAATQAQLAGLRARNTAALA